jgi:hypothetical protein
MTRKSFFYTGIAAFSLAAVVIAALHARRRMPVIKVMTPRVGPTVFVPGYRMLTACAAAGVLRN